MLSTIHPRLSVVLQVCFLWTVCKAEASFCTNDQQTKCKSAALSSNLDYLPEGGECEVSKYVEYTHLCSVTNYLPRPDYCCCAFEQRVFCCKYHYNANYFRCNENDIIHTLPPEPLPLEILIPAIVVPSVALLCFVSYCIKCCCCSDDDDDDDETCGIVAKCRRRRHKRHRKREKCVPARVSDHFHHPPQDSQSSTLLPPPTCNKPPDKPASKDYTDVKSPSSGSAKDDGSRPRPSAPPSAPPSYDLSEPWNPPPYNPDLYEPVNFPGVSAQPSSSTTAPPFIHYQNENGHDVIYQPVLATHASIALPVTKLTEQSKNSLATSEKNGGLLMVSVMGPR